MIIDYFLNFHYGKHIPLEYAVVLAAQVFLYISAAGMFSGLSWLLNRAHIGTRIESRDNYPTQFIKDLKGSILTCSIIALYLYISFSFINHTSPHSLKSAIGNIIVFLLLYNLYMYLSHRALHFPYLGRFHAIHHTAISATPWSSLNMHPVEALINYLPFLLFAGFSSVSLLVFLGLHIYLILGIANSHGNYSLFSRPARLPILGELSTFHQKHHSDGRGNYGYLFTHYDWLFGTRHPSEPHDLSK